MERFGFLLRIRPGAEAEYLRRHDEIWPEMVDALHRAGARNYSIYFDQDSERLFAYLEAEPDVETYQRRIGDDPVNARWQEHMRDLLIPVSEGGGPSPRLRLAFHLD
ncbi:MAG: L-rhamnose mutarotase [Candidatus Dormiibacterota bacterium]